MIAPEEQLIIFLKAPRPGTVKTRLAQSVGPERACQIYRELVTTVLDHLRSIAHVQLRFSPDDARAEVEIWMQPGWTAVPQGEGDLGARLARSFDDAFQAGAQRVIVVGSDVPEVEAKDIQSAFQQLREFELVVGPAVDGGYWLIGLRAQHLELFKGIEWSSDKVLGQTLARAKGCGLRIQLGRILSDVDTEADWDAYVRQRRK